MTLASTLPTDRHCRKPLCIRHITRQQSSGDYRFEVEWHTSAGIIKTVGWRWIRAHNRIVAPTCNGHHIFKLPPNVRAAIRNLFTRLMAEDKNINVPAIGGRKPNVTENHYGEMAVGMVPNVPAELAGRSEL